MHEFDIDIPTADGLMNTFVVHPDEGGPYPVVVFLMDALGKREELHEMARRIAAVGYCVVLPNLYYRERRDFVLVPDDAGFAEMFALMGTLSNALVVDDIRALLEFAQGRWEADSARVGVLGYCMSGPFAISAAAHIPHMLCAASIHGANLVTDRDDSPHRVLDRVRCELYFACAEIDRWVPKSAVETLEQALRAAGTHYRLEWYHGAQHGFVFPKRDGIYDRASAERHWHRLFMLFERNLKS